MNNQLVIIKDGLPTTTSLVIAEQFGRKHSHVVRSIEKLEDKYGIVPIFYQDGMNRTQKMYELTKRQALIAMPYIGGVKSEEGHVKLVDAYLILEEQVKQQKQTLESRLNIIALPKSINELPVNNIKNRDDDVEKIKFIFSAASAISENNLYKKSKEKNLTKPATKKIIDKLKKEGFLRSLFNVNGTLIYERIADR